MIIHYLYNLLRYIILRLVLGQTILLTVLNFWSEATAYATVQPFMYIKYTRSIIPMHGLRHVLSVTRKPRPGICGEETREVHPVAKAGLL